MDIHTQELREFVSLGDGHYLGRPLLILAGMDA